MKYEKTQPGNPLQLTVRQHVISAKSLERFAGEEGCVEVRTVRSPKVLLLRPENPIFTLPRAWDQRAEVGWMKRIEDRFQALVDDILCGKVEHITGDDTWKVTHYFSLWYWRSRQQPPEEMEYQFAGVTGERLTLEQEERFEKQHVMFTRAGGRTPTRFLTGIQLQVRVDQYAHLVLKDWTWGVIQAQAGEFLMPDVPHHGFAPLAPNVLLAANHPNGTVLKSNLMQINIAFLAYSWSYFVARNIRMALAGITDQAILKAVKERDSRIAAGELLHGPVPAERNRSTR